MCADQDGLFHGNFQHQKCAQIDRKIGEKVEGGGVWEERSAGEHDEGVQGGNVWDIVEEADGGGGGVRAGEDGQIARDTGGQDETVAVAGKPGTEGGAGQGGQHTDRSIPGAWLVILDL